MTSLRLDHYANTLRPFFDPLETVNELFILPGPHALGRNFNYRLGALKKSYNLDVPNATRIRKAGVSTAASKLDVQQINLLAKQMAHSSQTASRWYQMKSLPTDSVEAYRMIQRIRTGDQPQEQQEDSDTSDSDPEQGPKRMKWTCEQKVVADYFSGTIAAGQSASREVCRLCSKANLCLAGIEAKKIQDKVSTMIRQKRQ